MLTRLTIRDIVLIDRLELEFDAGLTVMTGETGAGKSILLDALGLAVGRRAEAKLVRPGADRASVTAEFDLQADHAAHAILTENEIPPAEGGGLLLRRVLNADGRSRAFVNDEPVGVSVLRAVGETLVEIQGQFDQHGLMDPVTHLTLLDAFAGNGDARARTESAYRSWRTAKSALASAMAASEDAAREEERLRFIVDELDKLAPKLGEEAELDGRRTFLRNAEKLSDAITVAREALEGDAGAEAALGQAIRALERAAGEADGRFTDPLEALSRAVVELEEGLAALNRVSQDLSPDEGRLEEVEERLFALRDMARKHRVECDGLPKLRETVGRQLDLLDGRDGALAMLERQAAKSRGDYVAAAEALGNTRRSAAEALNHAVNRELPPLKLEKARFETVLEGLSEDQWNALGWDRVSFSVATNPGMPAGALDKIASGGELSRFLLAIKLALAEKDSVPSLVFDEVDSGVGGATAAAVGERLDRLAEGLQILVVTHSPQVAARGSAHLRVAKAMRDQSMVSDVGRLSPGDRLEEVARMLSGAEITEEARAAARRLIAGDAATEPRAGEAS